MKKMKDFDEFLKELEEAVDNMLDGMDIPENRPVNVDISINLCPFMVSNPENMSGRSYGKAPVDILETEKNIHALIGLPGMKLEDIKINCTGRCLEIMANNAGRSLNESIELPARANKKGMKTTYENGILEVVLTKPTTGKVNKKIKN